MVSGSASRRYARAILSIGQAQGNLEPLTAEVERLAQSIESSTDLRTVLLNPAFSQTQRQAVLDQVCQRLALTKTTQSLAQLLLSRGRLPNLPGIARSLRQMVDEVAGRIRVRLVSAKPLDAAAETRIRSALSKATGKTVLCDKSVDESLIGGVITQVGDVIYDGSIKGQLASLKTRWQG